jgi:hypothetical protein
MLVSLHEASLLICIESLNEIAGAVSQLSEVECAIEATIISTLNLVPYKKCTFLLQEKAPHTWQP